MRPSRFSFLHRVKPGIFLCSALGLWGGHFDCENAFAQQGGLAIEVVAARDGSGNAYLPHGEAFEVRLSNLSDQPIVVWNERCALGHTALSFETKEVSGQKVVVQKRPVAASVWTNYPPKPVVIPSKSNYTLKVNLSDFFWGERAWLNVPEPNTDENIELRAVFEIAPTAEARAQGVWTGRIESAGVTLPILNPKLKTPQDYLWNACPQQALRMLMRDPTWIRRGDEKDQCTPLHHAARFGYKDVVVWLIENGADVNAVAYNRFTPLHFAGRKEIAAILIKAGADLDHRDSFGKTVLQSAAETRMHELVDAIMESGYKANLYETLVLNRRDLVLKMLIGDPDVVVGGDGGRDLGQNTTPLGWAAAQGDLELAKLLVEAGAPIDDPTDNIRYGGYVTPLCNAVWAGKVEMVEFLLSKGAATNVVGGKFYRSITEYAERHSDRKIVDLLTKYGTNPRLEYSRDIPETKNKLPKRIASGEFKLPDEIKGSR